MGWCALILINITHYGCSIASVPGLPHHVSVLIGRIRNIMPRAAVSIFSALSDPICISNNSLVRDIGDSGSSSVDSYRLLVDIQAGPDNAEIYRDCSHHLSENDSSAFGSSVDGSGIRQLAAAVHHATPIDLAHAQLK